MQYFPVCDKYSKRTFAGVTAKSTHYLSGELQMQSRVKWFDNVKGYGFIESADGQDIFVHYKQIEGDGYKTLREGQQVEFELSQGAKGPLATNVRLLA